MRKNAKVIALLPESVPEAEQYLEGEGVHVDQVRQVHLEGIGVRGTPTMFLVNSGGIVTKIWTGKIEPQEQGLVLKSLGG
jgi:hypothetical protein